jgi:GWxTD domain-containing protein
VRAFLRVVPAVLAVGALVFWVPGSAKERKESLSKWLDGPIHYLVDSAEIKEFKAQKTDKDRADFIERFWRRRDPTANTLVNEYRQLFWNRVKEANEKFLDSPKPGWQTDRGRIYILYGPPDEMKEDPNAKATSEVGDSRGLIRWVYLKPGGRNDMDPVVYVPFVRDVTGEYHVSYDPKLASPFFTWSQVEDNRTVGMGETLTSLQHGATGDSLSVMLDLGRLQEVPPQEAIILDSVETVETFAYDPLAIAIDRFQPDGKGLLVVLTVGMPGPSGVEPPSVLARFSKKGVKTGAQILGEGSFRIEGEGDQRVAQGRVLLGAGSWELTVLSVEPGTGKSRIFRGRVDPLPGGPALHLSDVVLASTMKPLQFAAQASYDAPYIVGGFSLTPRPEPALPRGSLLQVFFEIYGGTAPYHVVYQLEGREKDDHWVALGKPQENDASERGQGFAIETSASWPVGVYRLRIKVVDAVAASVEAAETWSLTAHP